jgi:sugar phosphate isomerase/epimerase
MNLYISTSAFAHRQISDIFSLCLKHGFDRVELGSTVDYCPDVVDCMRQAHRRIQFLIHNYFPPSESPFVLNLASTDMSINRRSIDLCRNAIDLAGEVESPFYSVHAGYAFDLKPEMLGDTEAQCQVDPILQIPPEDAYERFVETITKLAVHAQSRGVQLLVENNVITQELALKKGKGILMLTCADEILRFFRDVNSPYVGLLLDTGHLNVSSRTLGFERMSFVDRLAGYIRGIHVHDNDGITDRHLPIESGSWVLDILRREEFSDLPIIIESKFESITDLCGHVDWLKEILETDEILK